jgi:hypothetical protein
MNSKEFGRKLSWPNFKGLLVCGFRGASASKAICTWHLRYYPRICLEDLRKATRKLSRDSRSFAPDLNPRPPEYEARLLKARPRRSTCCSGLWCSVDSCVDTTVSKKSNTVSILRPVDDAVPEQTEIMINRSAHFHVTAVARKSFNVTVCPQ